MYYVCIDFIYIYFNVTVYKINEKAFYHNRVLFQF